MELFTYVSHERGGGGGGGGRVGSDKLSKRELKSAKYVGKEGNLSLLYHLSTEASFCSFR